MARLAPDAPFVVQATSPLFARQSFWCIAATIEQAGLTTAPYHVYVPSFGEWGYVIAFAFFILTMFVRPQGLFGK